MKVPEKPQNYWGGGKQGGGGGKQSKKKNERSQTFWFKLKRQRRECFTKLRRNKRKRTIAASSARWRGGVVGRVTGLFHPSALCSGSKDMDRVIEKKCFNRKEEDQRTGTVENDSRTGGRRKKQDSKKKPPFTSKHGNQTALGNAATPKFGPRDETTQKQHIQHWVQQVGVRHGGNNMIEEGTGKGTTGGGGGGGGSGWTMKTS